MQIVRQTQSEVYAVAYKVEVRFLLRAFDNYARMVQMVEAYAQAMKMTLRLLRTS